MIKLHLSESSTYFWYIKYWCQDQCLNINLSVIRKWNTSYNSNQIQFVMDHSEFDVINLITNHFSTLNTLIFNYNFTHFWNSLLLFKEYHKFFFSVLSNFLPIYWLFVCITFLCFYCKSSKFENCVICEYTSTSISFQKNNVLGYESLVNFWTI